MINWIVRLAARIWGRSKAALVASAVVDMVHTGFFYVISEDSCEPFCLNFNMRYGQLGIVPGVQPIMLKGDHFFCISVGEEWKDRIETLAYESGLAVLPSHKANIPPQIKSKTCYVLFASHKKVWKAARSKARHAWKRFEVAA